MDLFVSVDESSDGSCAFAGSSSDTVPAPEFRFRIVFVALRELVIFYYISCALKILYLLSAAGNFCRILYWYLASFFGIFRRTDGHAALRSRAEYCTKGPRGASDFVFRGSSPFPSSRHVCATLPYKVSR